MEKSKGGVVYNDCGTHFTVSVDGSIMRCVSCNKPKEYRKLPDGTKGLCFHRCDKVHEAARKSQAKRTFDASEREMPEGRRLFDGFEMMHACGD